MVLKLRPNLWSLATRYVLDFKIYKVYSNRYIHILQIHYHSLYMFLILYPNERNSKSDAILMKIYLVIFCTVYFYNVFLSHSINKVGHKSLSFRFTGLGLFIHANFALSHMANTNTTYAENWMLCFDKSKESAVFSIILQRFLVIFLTPTFISFTKLKIRQSFWGAEQV